jgi:hypothetical protein
MPPKPSPYHSKKPQWVHMHNVFSSDCIVMSDEVSFNKSSKTACSVKREHCKRFHVRTGMHYNTAISALVILAQTGIAYQLVAADAVVVSELNAEVCSLFLSSKPQERIAVLYRCRQSHQTVPKVSKRCYSTHFTFNKQQHSKPSAVTEPSYKCCICIVVLTHTRKDSLL